MTYPPNQFGRIVGFEQEVLLSLLGEFIVQPQTVVRQRRVHPGRHDEMKLWWCQLDEQGDLG